MFSIQPFAAGSHDQNRSRRGAGTDGGSYSYIKVGGPGKVLRDGKLDPQAIGDEGEKLTVLKYRADQDGVRARAFYEAGTPDAMLDKAREILGTDNVEVFSPPLNLA